MDFRQYGGSKGNSVAHYMIELINFILYNQDSKDATSVLACFIDFSKAFNRQDHSILVTRLSNMGVPSWLLKLVISFLMDRKMILKYKNEKSDMRSLPGGGPQGTLLGLFLFLILINDLGFENQQQDLAEIITVKHDNEKMKEIHLKYVDDLTVAESISMKSQLLYQSNDSRPQPDTFHERTGHYINPQDSKVHQMIRKTEEYCEQNKMKINYKKTKLMVFNPGFARDFLPRFTFNGDELEVVEETKLLGIVLRSDLSWSSNTDYMVKRANRKLWCLKRLKRLGATSKDLIDVYNKQIRSLLEFSATLWHPNLTETDRMKIERVQKSALRIILSQNYKSYNSALLSLKTDSLFARRENLCKKFALKSVKSTKFTNWFKPATKSLPTRGIPNKFKEVHSRTERFEKSPNGVFTNILNGI